MNEAITAVNDLLKEWGLNPNDIVADGFSPWGYLTFRRDMAGRVVVQDGAAVVEANDWPKGFPYREFERLVEVWQSEVRHA